MTALLDKDGCRRIATAETDVLKMLQFHQHQKVDPERPSHLEWRCGVYLRHAQHRLRCLSWFFQGSSVLYIIYSDFEYALKLVPTGRWAQSTRD